VSGTLSAQKPGDADKAKQDADKAAREERDRLEKAKAEGQGKALYEQSKDRVEGAKKTLDTYADIKATMKKNATDIALDAEKTFSKQTEERFTKYFEERAKKRVGQKLTTEETALLKALNSTISADFKDATLKEVLEFITPRRTVSSTSSSIRRRSRMPASTMSPRSPSKAKASRCARCSRRSSAIWV